MDAAIRAQGLCKWFGEGRQRTDAVRDVTFEARFGELLYVVGPSGSGKTTLLGLCAGLDQPSAGEVHLAGIHLGKLDEDGRARVRNELIGFVFQNFQLIPTLNAVENVMVPLELRGQRRVRDRAAELLARVGLGERLSRATSAYAG